MSLISNKIQIVKEFSFLIVIIILINIDSRFLSVFLLSSLANLFQYLFSWQIIYHLSFFNIFCFYFFALYHIGINLIRFYKKSTLCIFELKYSGFTAIITNRADVLLSLIRRMNHFDITLKNILMLTYK